MSPNPSNSLAVPPVQWIRLARVDSTQAELKRRLTLDPHLPAWTVVLAEAQTQSIGRHGRSWITLPGALALSVLLRPELASQAMPWISVAAGLAMVDGLAELGIEARLKWPNDIMSHGLKVGGLIAHALEIDSHTRAVALGLGLNLTGQRSAFNTWQLEQASTLEAENGAIEASIDHIAELWLAWLNNRLASLEADGPSSLLPDYRRALADVGRRAQVRTADEKHISGKLVGVNDQGELEIQTDSGRIETVLAGIVEWHM